MIVEYDVEPVRGLPGDLPQGERILWQGSPDAWRLAVHAYHIRAVAIYFALLAGWGAVGALRGVNGWTGTLMTLGIGAIGLAVIGAIAWGAARTTVYTLTNKRIVLRFGIALPKCVNLPLGTIAAADLAMQGKGIGDIALRLTEQQRLGWMQLWPHARPWALTEVQPMLRSISEAENVAGLLARTVGAAQGTPAAATPPVLAVAA
ncbi:photosynthetic complex putative assembly protein PuhB [Sphingomonas sp. SUN039]|uniref:photosynthetic complex putative assembly protein PuhB n=1 Tax=Sphingomonas sp. SUN039 TaxID=2937787 RepID=UPI0021648E8E|nr:photosynthetic complex putative assembly protein PuhB [Sphingomonas sp. SUN039]UVO54118.1 PH domain-containing protein [Sphingomonas sp. SUN039]